MACRLLSLSVGFLRPSRLPGCSIAARRRRLEDNNWSHSMKNIFVSHHHRGRWVAGALLPLLVAPVMAVDLSTADGKWTFSIDGNVNADYVYSNCQSANSAKSIDGGLTSVGRANGNSVSRR